MSLTDQPYRDLMHVRRWAIVPTLDKQSVAEHSFYVALYAIEIAENIGFEVRPELLRHALTHDLEEIHSGDIPTPYKERYDERTTQPPNDCTPEEVAIVKLADMLEAWMFLNNEIRLGNYRVEKIMDGLTNKLFAAAAGLGVEVFINNVVFQARRYKGRDR